MIVVIVLIIVLVPLILFVMAKVLEKRFSTPKVPKVIETTKEENSKLELADPRLHISVQNLDFNSQ